MQYMKILKSMPKDTAFFDRYAPLIHGLKRFAPITQFLTGAAEIGIIYSLIYPSFSDLFPSVAHPLSITGSLFAASILQIGLKLVFPYSVRAILFKRFAGLDLAFSIVVFALTIALLSVSVTLSYKGSADIVEVAIQPPSDKTTTATDSIKAATERSANAVFSTDSMTIEIKYLGKGEALQSEYNTRINEAENRANNARHKSPIYAKELSQKATNLKAELRAKLATMQADKAAEIEQKASERKATINRALDRNDKERAQIETANSEAKAATKDRKSRYKNYVGYFTLFCYIFFLLVYSLDEIYKKGAKIEASTMPHQRHFLPPLFAELSEAIKARLDTFFRSKIYAFADKTKASPLPVALPVLYEYKADALKNIYTIETEKEETKTIKLPAKPLRVAAKNEAAKGDETTKKARQIGFKIGDDSKDEASDKENETPIHNDFRNTGNFKDDSLKVVTNSSDYGKCENCENDFFRNHKKQRFCCDDCRKESWKNKTGKAFDLELKTKERLKKK